MQDRIAVGVACAAVCGTWLLLSGSARGQHDKRVLVIGIDGAGGGYTLQADTPHLDALAATGSIRYDFQNEGALTPNPPAGYGASGVNWSTILTGVGAPTHGVVDNSFSGNRFAEFPSLFHYIKQHQPTAFTASIAHWNPINTQILADADMNLEIGNLSDVAVRDAAVNLISSGNPTAMFVHFDEVDAAGHSAGWGSAAYLDALQEVDVLVGDLVAAVNNRPGVVGQTEDWLVIVTSDHGGAGFSHFAGQGPINWDVPFIVSGASVLDGVAMQRGSLRDVAATALWHLGIDPFELGLEGTVRGLSVDPPNGIVGDINQDGLLSGNGTGTVATDDVSAFLSHWLATGDGSVLDRYQRGDLNLDGVTDLADWALLNRLNPAMGSAIGKALSGQPVPEPTAMSVAGITLTYLCLARIRKWC